MTEMVRELSLNEISSVSGGMEEIVVTAPRSNGGSKPSSNPASGPNNQDASAYQQQNAATTKKQTTNFSTARAGDVSVTCPPGTVPSIQVANVNVEILGANMTISGVDVTCK